MSAATKQKADRLLAQGKVEPLPDAQVFVVTGDHGAYLTVLDGETSHCSCPALLECAHVRAARMSLSTRNAAALETPGVLGHEGTNDRTTV